MLWKRMKQEDDKYFIWKRKIKNWNETAASDGEPLPVSILDLLSLPAIKWHPGSVPGIRRQGDLFGKGQTLSFHSDNTLTSTDSPLLDHSSEVLVVTLPTWGWRWNNKKRAWILPYIPKTTTLRQNKIRKSECVMEAYWVVIHYSSRVTVFMRGEEKSTFCNFPKHLVFFPIIKL